MRRLSVCLILAILVSGMVAIPGVQSTAAVPSLVNYQGILTNGGGTPQVGTFTVTFAIYPVPTGGTSAWSETQSVTTDSQGRFGVLLGTNTPLTDTAFNGALRYLGTTVSPDPEMLPRIQFTSVAYAHRVSTVDSASGGTIISKVSIGPGHTNTGKHAFIAGANNTASGEVATVPGGANNIAAGLSSVVGGGEGNDALGAFTSVAGGLLNVASGDSSSVGGGVANLASGNSATTAGGRADTAAGDFSSVCGGQSNRADNAFSCVAGGRANHAAQTGSSIGGGVRNSAAGVWSVVAGGLEDTALGQNAFVGGGAFNSAWEGAVVGGGTGNKALGSDAVIGGGASNYAGGQLSFIGGGDDNLASGDKSTVGGGEADSALGNLACVPGGARNRAAGIASFAAGNRAHADHDGSVVVAANSETTLPDAIASGCAEQFVARADGNFYFTNTSGTAPCTAGRFINTSTGAYLTTGGTWTNLSDQTRKANITEVDGSAVLEKVAALPISEWNYLSESDGVRHIGPMAQDFHAAFGLGNDDKSITTIDADGVALAAIQALYKRNQELESMVEKLQTQFEKIQASLAAGSR